MKKVAVVILNWNGEALLKRFLPSVIAHTPTDIADIIVADNGSTDQSMSLITQEFPSVKQIQLDQNYGFAEGYNRAIEQIEHTYTVLLNSDVEVSPNWLDAPVQALDANPLLAGVQPKIRDQKNKSQFEYAGAAGGWIDRYGFPFCRGRILDTIEADHGQYDKPADILWASGACLFIRTDVYKKEGGLDADFFAHQEEIDLCWRLRSRGYRLACIPESVVYHVGGATLDTVNPRKTFLNYRNNLLMLYKNLPDKELSHVFRIRFWLDYVAWFKFFLTGQTRTAQALIQARKEFKRLKKKYLPIRKENLAKTVVSSIPEILPQSLIVSYYFKGKKKFTDLFTDKNPSSSI